MKQCPNCQRNYPNNAAPFCAEDGTRLIEVSTADNLPTQISIPQPLPEHSFRVPQTANGNLETKRQTGIVPTVLGIAAILLSLGGIFVIVILTNFYTNENLYYFLLFLCGGVGLALAATALVFGFLVRKGRVVAVLGIIASLIPLGMFIFDIGGYYADKAGLFDSFNSSRSDSTSTTTDDGDTASNTPRDALIAFSNACQRANV